MTIIQCKIISHDLGCGSPLVIHAPLVQFLVVHQVTWFSHLALESNHPMFCGLFFQAWVLSPKIVHLPSELSAVPFLFLLFISFHSPKSVTEKKAHISSFSLPALVFMLGTKEAENAFGENARDYLWLPPPLNPFDPYLQSPSHLQLTVFIWSYAMKNFFCWREWPAARQEHLSHHLCSRICSRMCSRYCHFHKKTLWELKQFHFQETVIFVGTFNTWHLKCVLGRSSFGSPCE